jgi:PAS domain S-box-containing protein
MIKPETPHNEIKRHASLCALNLLDTPAEERFDRITRRAQKHFDVPITLVSLIDTDRQWFKSKQGLEAIETPRDVSFCGHAILSNKIFYIPDAHEDKRFADNPLVTNPPHVRFYAGAPLRAPNGQRIGTLCIIDHQPREFTSEELNVLRDFADEVEDELAKNSSQIKISIAQKIGLSSVFLVLLSAGMVGGLFYNKTTTLLVQHALDSVSKEVQYAGERLKSIISTQDEDVLFLAHTPPIQGILRAQKNSGYDELGKTDTEEWGKRLATIFRSQIMRKSAYLSIRFIDTNGQELVVVSRRGNEIVSLSGKDLQNKIHRDYVSEALKLPAGSVYVSELNLNREFGQLTQPHQEVIRNATPIIDEKTGKTAGLLTITAEIGEKLQAIQRRVRNTRHSEIYITNDRGDYLLHPDPSKKYGFELGKNHTIQTEFPEVNNLFLANNNDTQISLKSEIAEGWQALNFTKIFFDPNNEKRFIAVVITHDYSGIVEEQSKVLDEVVYWILLLIFFGAGLGILFAINLTRPIKQITLAMQDYIHQRNRKEQMPVHLNNEIGVMARIYKTLIDQVDEAHSNLEEMNRELEARVIERTKAQEMSEVRQRAIVENIIDGLITIDGKGSIASFNPAASQIFGYAADEVIGRNIKMLMPEPYMSEHDSYLHNFLTTGEQKIIGIGREVTGKRKDSTTFPMDLSVSEMQIDGERMFTGIVRDITERKKVDQMKSEFISTVSHELRTPLTSIRGALGLVVGKASKNLSPKILKMLQMAVRNSERLTLLINDILDLEKIESGLLEFDFKSVDLVVLAQQALADYEGFAHQHKIKLELETSLEQAFVTGDSHRLLQVFANIISNAVKYSPENGCVKITVNLLDNSYRVAVSDTGTGIPDEFRSSIFQRFAQADSSDTREKGGTGLGLSITKAIVERHNGYIDFESKQGEGTMFYFDIPVMSIDEKEEAEAIDHAQVLICEDDLAVAQIIAEMLKTENLTCDIVSSAESARKRLSEGSYGLLLLDLSLPDMDGLVFLKELRANSITMNLPIIVISARAIEGKAQFTGDAVMVADWIQKPVDQSQLARAMNEALQRNTRPRILHIEDDLDIIQVIKELLDDVADVSHESSLKGARERLNEQEYDLVILDLGLSDGSGVDLFDELKGRCPIIIFSAQDPDRDISAQVTAALTKSMTSNEQLLSTIKTALQGNKK